MRVKVSLLKKQIYKVVSNKYDTTDSHKLTDIVLFGELSGRKSHGLVRLLIGDKSILAQKPQGKPIINQITSKSVVIDGNKNPGMLVGVYAMEELIKIAKKEGLAIVGTKNTFSTSGSLAYYLEKIANVGLIGIIMAESPLSTPPYGGIEPMFGTNPISFGIPTNSKPIIFDMGTSAITFGNLLKARTLNQKIPEGVAIDKNGKPTTDPQEAIDGATLSFDNSYKGVGLAFMVEILAGLLPGAGFSGINESDGWGNLFIAISPKLFGSQSDFKNKTEQLINKIKNSKPLPGEKIRIPGESTLGNRDLALQSDEVEVDDYLYSQLKQAAKT